MTGMLLLFPVVIHDSYFDILETAVLSTLFSPYRREAFLGDRGRYQGLLTLILYGMQFYIIAENKENDVVNSRVFRHGGMKSSPCFYPEFIM